MEQLQPGQMLGAYRIIEQVGEGGMATVYKAHQTSMDRHVAIKVLPLELAKNDEFVQRFQQEARIIAKLEHPHILPVFDYGEENGILYFAMRYLDTGTLKDKLLSETLSLDEVNNIFIQLAGALGYAHAQGVVHRDLKPANVLVDANGNLFLTDFGIAKILESASPSLTQTSAVMGTPTYISPEQASALPIDQRTDIYSLGVMLYEMVTGQVPFVADTPLGVIIKHLSEPLPLPSLVNPEISPAIEQVLLKALAKETQDRFSNVAEFVSAWKQALQGVDVSPDISQKGLKPALPTQEKPAASTRAVPKSGRSLIGYGIGCIAVICLAFSALGGLGLASQFFNRASTPTQASIIPGEIILQENFSGLSTTWGVVDDENSYVYLDNEALRMVISKRNWFVWSSPNSIAYRDVYLETTVINNDTDQYTTFGLFCNQQTDGQSFYYFGITPAGQYAIARVDSGTLENFITNNGQWGYSNLIETNAPSYHVEAACGNGVLTLSVNGKQIDTVTDTTYTSGRAGVFIWSAEQATKTDISFDDFLLANLP
jgi:serine/threonine-protein kinase